MVMIMKKRIMMLILIVIHISVLFWGSFTNNLIITYAWHGITFIGSIYYLLKEKTKFKLILKDLKNNWMYLIIASLLTGLAYYASQILLSYVFDSGVIINTDNINASDLVFVSINLLIWAPIVEEVIMRYLYKNTIVNKYAFILISTLFFGLIHSLSIFYPINIIMLCAIPFFVIGLYLSLIYIKTDNIFINIIAHFLINLIGMIMIFIAM